MKEFPNLRPLFPSLHKAVGVYDHKPSPLSKCYRYIRLRLWRSPVLYCPVALARQRAWIFSNKYDILIDGYPRSANSFASEGLRIVAPKLRILSHRHIPTYIIQAAKSQKPVVLLIRNPIEAVASWVVYSKNTIQFALHSYVDYYKVIKQYTAALLVVPYSRITFDFNYLIRGLNYRFRTKLAVSQELSIFNEAVTQRVRALPWGNDPLKVSLPDDRRRQVQQGINDAMVNWRKRPEMTAASKLYDHFCAVSLEQEAKRGEELGPL